MSEMFAAFICAKALPDCVFIEEIRSQSPWYKRVEKRGRRPDESPAFSWQDCRDLRFELWRRFLKRCR
jgi:hypothetical protein